MGGKTITPGLPPIQIGPIDSPQPVLSITVDWAITATRNGIVQTRPLESDEEHTADVLTPRFVVQTGGARVSYPIDPSLSPGMFRLGAHEMACMFVTTTGISEQRLTELWDRIALTSLETDVLAALRLIAPGIVNLNFVSTPLSGGERVPLVKVAESDEPLSLYSLGDGMLRALGISLALVNAKNGILLIDEFENGLYYTVQSDIRQLIFRVARRLNVQVFVTTHSWDCIEAFQKATQEEHPHEGLLIRLEHTAGAIIATTFDTRQLGIATREHIEVR